MKVVGEKVGFKVVGEGVVGVKVGFKVVGEGVVGVNVGLKEIEGAKVDGFEEGEDVGEFSKQSSISTPVPRLIGSK